MRVRYRRRNRGIVISLLLIISALLLISMAVRSLSSSPEQEAEQVVHEFYKNEQDGDFASSWSLFHSSMKKRFTKGHYIQDRAHVFMNHFGVETFSYSLSKPNKLENWKMSKDTPPFKLTYKLTITQTYKGKYGNFDIQQDVFVVKEKGDWTILWDYNQ
jgi:hypothetical protein